MRTKRFKFDGTWSDTFGIGLSAYSVYNGPSRDVESFHIPGINGDGLIDSGSFQNRRVVYACWLAGNFKTKVDDFRDFLLAHAGKYYELEDEYHPQHVMMARYLGPFEPKTSVMLRVGEFDVSFDAKPQLFRKEGMAWVDAGTYSISTRHPYHPLLKITGAGTVTLQGQNIKVTSGGPSVIYLDTETLEAYGEDDSNCNQYVQTPFDGIVVQPGSVTLSASGCTVQAQLRYFDM